jgi:polar amino acid transport system ATP-binding protein
MNERPALLLEDVYKSFGENEVLKGIDLTVEPHEVVCLIGASGSGKSVLLRCVNLVEPIDSGRVVVDGEEITAAGVDTNRIRRGIGIVYQSFNLFPHMTVLRNITLAPREALGTDRAEAEKNARALLERFGLLDKQDEYPDRLSGGQQQRVAIVRALAMRPHLMLLGVAGPNGIWWCSRMGCTKWSESCSAGLARDGTMALVVAPRLGGKGPVD